MDRKFFSRIILYLNIFLFYLGETYKVYENHGNETPKQALETFSAATCPLVLIGGAAGYLPAGRLGKPSAYGGIVQLTILMRYTFKI
jgi:hypothetical protein